MYLNRTFIASAVGILALLATPADGAPDSHPEDTRAATATASTGDTPRQVTEILNDLCLPVLCEDDMHW